MKLKAISATLVAMFLFTFPIDVKAQTEPPSKKIIMSLDCLKGSLLDELFGKFKLQQIIAGDGEKGPVKIYIDADGDLWILIVHEPTGFTCQMSVLRNPEIDVKEKPKPGIKG